MASSESKGVEVVRLDAARAASDDYPRLTRIGAKLLRGFGEVMTTGGTPVTLTGGSHTTLSFSEWKASLPESIAVARYRAAPIKGGLLVSFPTALVTRMVDRLYGGDGTTDRPSRPFGAAERRLFARLAADVGEVLDAGWLDVMPVAPELIGEAFALENVTLIPPDHQVIVQNFAISDGKREIGTVAVVYPAAALRGIAALHMADENDIAESDPVWQARLADAVLQARLPVRTIICRPTVSLHVLMSLAPGDVIPVTLPARVPLTAAGKLFAHGTIGEANGRAAIKIEKLEHGAKFDD